MLHEEQPDTPGEPVAARELRYPGGFDEFFRTEYQSVVKALMLSERTSPADADDCVAHAMGKLFARWSITASEPGYVSRPRAYVMKTARRRFWKEQRRIRATALDDVEPGLGAEDPALTALEEQQCVADILGFLSLAQRRVMHLIADGYTPSEIAAILHKTPNNIRQTAYQSRQRLRPLLQPPAGDPAQREEDQ